MVPRDPALDPVIVPTLEPVIVPVREPVIVPTRSLIAPVLEPVMVPPYEIVAEESSTTAAIMIFRSRVMLVLLVDEILLGRCGMERITERFRLHLQFLSKESTSLT